MNTNGPSETRGLHYQISHTAHVTRYAIVFFSQRADRTLLTYDLC